MNNDELYDKIRVLLSSANLDENTHDKLLRGIREIEFETDGRGDAAIHELTFDLSVNALEEYYPKQSVNRAWYEIGNYLILKGFDKKSDSDYISREPITHKDIVDILDDIKEKYPWFEMSTTKVLSAIITEQSNVKDRWESERTDKEKEDIKNTLIFNKQNKDLALPNGFIVTSKTEDDFASGKILVEPQKQIKGCNLKYILDMDKREATLVINEKPMGIKPLNRDTVSRFKDVYDKAKQPDKEVSKAMQIKKSHQKDDDFER